ncbi:MAG: serine/threonine protein kinase [Myxococcales bacterium]|nr:serine/threonine protein kinase [Myxococcales bacterium]
MNTHTPTAPAADPLVGVLVAGKYRVLGLVARGGMGRIYRAEQLPLGREVALKILTRPLLGSDHDDSALEKRFLLEAATCARLKHQNTVNVFDYGALDVAGDPTFYMVMELVRGRTLAQAIRQDGPFPAVRAARVAFEIARSLREAHGAGVVHRDLKPSNVMLVETDEGESVKVLDFGVAKVMTAGTEVLTTDGSFVGSPRYTAPEQVRQESVDGRADLYALGVVLWEMLTGAAPFSSAEPIRTLMMHLNDPLPAFVSAHPVPPALEAAVRRLLEKSPADRYADADAVVLALRSLRGSGADEYVVEPAAVDAVTEPTGAFLGPASPPVWASMAVVAVGIGVALVVTLLVVSAAGWFVSQGGRSGGEPDGPALAEAIDALAADGGPVLRPKRAGVDGVGGDEVVIEADPGPAEVWIGGKKVGDTPYRLRYDAAATLITPLEFELRRPGFRGTPLAVAGRDDDGVIRATLQKRVEAPRGPQGPSGQDDIRLER